MGSEDTEITLGVGRLLGLFFLLAAICGVFFSIGYSLGKSNAREQALNDGPSRVLAAAPMAASVPAQPGDKPSAAVTSQPEVAAPAQEQSSAASPQNNLTFYKAVQQDSNNHSAAPAKNSSPASAPLASEANGAAAATAVANSAPAKQPSSQGATPPVSASAPVTGPGTIVVQIAALTREDDAVALAGALRKKDYNVFVVKNPAVNDKFYHVQVGPFTTLRDAEAMKARLIAEGYNPIVKR